MPDLRKQAGFHFSTRRVWRCKVKHPEQQFTFKVGTIFEHFPLGPAKWLLAVWVVSNCKNEDGASARNKFLRQFGHLALRVRVVALLALAVCSAATTGESLKLNDFTLTWGDGMSVAMEEGKLSSTSDHEAFELTFDISNKTRLQWYSVEFSLDITADCRSGPFLLNIPVSAPAAPLSRDHFKMSVRMSALAPPLSACLVKAQTTKFLRAKGEDWYVDATTGEHLDIKQQREIAQKEYDRDEAVRKKDSAAVEARRRRAVEKQRRADAETARRLAEEDAKVRDGCSFIYRSTANKRVGDLTVREQQQIRACEVFGYYAPAR